MLVAWFIGWLAGCLVGWPTTHRVARDLVGSGRLNVALTRAKQILLVVGHEETLRSWTSWGPRPGAVGLWLLTTSRGWISLGMG